MAPLASTGDAYTSSGLSFDQAIWREQILLRLAPFTRNPTHELRLSGSDSALAFLLYQTIQPFCTAYEHAPIASVLSLAELTRRPGANYLVHHSRRFLYQGAPLVERELRHNPELRLVLDELALELRTFQVVLQRLSRTRVEWLRRALIQDLARFGGRSDFAHIRRQLSDPEWQSRFVELQALRSLRGVYGPAELALLGECLEDTSSHVRSAAARLLGHAQMRLPETLLRQLLQVAVHDGDLETRSAAARASGVLRVQLAIPTLLQSLHELLHDDDPFVRSATAIVLGQLGDIVTRPATHDALADLLADGDAYVREAAARALGRIGAPAAVSRVLARLAQAVEDPDASVHDAALEALGRLRILRSTQPLSLATAENIPA
jgi:HEAT repeat protein